MSRPGTSVPPEQWGSGLGGAKYNIVTRTAVRSPLCVAGSIPDAGRTAILVNPLQIASLRSNSVEVIIYGISLSNQTGQQVFLAVSDVAEVRLPPADYTQSGIVAQPCDGVLAHAMFNDSHFRTMSVQAPADGPILIFNATVFDSAEPNTSQAAPAPTSTPTQNARAESRLPLVIGVTVPVCAILFIALVASLFRFARRRRRRRSLLTTPADVVRPYSMRQPEAAQVDPGYDRFRGATPGQLRNTSLSLPSTAAHQQMRTSVSPALESLTAVETDDEAVGAAVLEAVQHAGFSYEALLVSLHDIHNTYTGAVARPNSPPLPVLPTYDMDSNV